MKIKNILVCQHQPLNMSQYTGLIEKYGVDIKFHRFFNVEPLTPKEFRAQRVNILDYSAITFSSRHAIDAFFKLSEELRIKIPESMKYFCSTSAVAMYLQKHIIYRKRKIFYGEGTAESVLALIGTKHKDEKFLITTSSDPSSKELLINLFEKNIYNIKRLLSSSQFLKI